MPNLFENQTDLKKKKSLKHLKVSVLLFYFILFKL